MATSSHLLNQFCLKGWLNLMPKNSSFFERLKCPNRRNQSKGYQAIVAASFNLEPAISNTTMSTDPFGSLGHLQNSNFGIAPKSILVTEFLHIVSLATLDRETAKLAIGILGPALSAFGFLFILRIVMSWYPKLPVGKFPYVIAYAPTEPILVQTRKVIPPVGGVDVTPVVWFGIISFLNEILVGPQGLLVLVSLQ